MAGNGDVNAHTETYNGFMALMKWTTIVVLIITALVVWLIAA